MSRHLAQLNIARLHHPLDDPRSAEFVDGLPIVNGAGEASPGYIWRLQSETGDATDIRAFDDPLVIVNLTLWESLDALKAFAYRGVHRDYFRRRGEWFVDGSSRTALWWLPAGSRPTVDDAKRRLDFIDAFGVSPYAFEMGQQPPSLVIDRAALDDERSQRLIGELNAELSGMYPEPGATHFRLDPDEVSGDRGCFVVAEVDDVAVACGAYRRLDDGTAEIKRMYVARGVRGLKIGAALVSELEAAARAHGLHTLLLETGTRQLPALGLYEKFGFRRIECWGEYANSPTSICMEKPLSQRPGV
jgi:GNAT superfamily N-acetyltransferase